MKITRHILYLFVTAMVFVQAVNLASCKNDSTPSQQEVKKDTIRTLAAYMNYGLRGSLHGPVYEITQDSLMMVWVDKDSTTQKKKKTKFVSYFVPVLIPINDSITAKTFGVNKIDTVIERYVPSDAKYVRTARDYPDYDSSVKYLQQFIVYPKIDSTKK